MALRDGMVSKKRIRRAGSARGADALPPVRFDTSWEGALRLVQPSPWPWPPQPRSLPALATREAREDAWLQGVGRQAEAIYERMAYLPLYPEMDGRAVREMAGIVV
jgi:hypothetical protein